MNGKHMPATDILVIDDDTLMREYVEEAMIRAGYRVETASSGREGVDLFKKKRHDLVVTDLKMEPMGGVEVVTAVREVDAATPVIVMTAYGTIETAVGALKAGAEDYILKPFSPDAIGLAVERALERKRLAAENRYLRDQVNAPFNTGGMVGESAAMQTVYRQIQKVADTRATVFLRGENGTGKELVARAIHLGSSRANRPFIKVNCAALSVGILESELFGHERGAFTGAHEKKIGRFELAHTGTLLLDEVSEIGPDLQPKLLRALQEREFERVGGSDTIKVDTRIIATSNRNLEKAVEDGTFREDLYFRLNVIRLQLPPLRERREDIPALLDHYVDHYRRENGRAIDAIDPDAMSALAAYDWPGNVRELQNAVERAVILSDGPLLRAEHFQIAESGARHTGASELTPGTTVAQVEQQLVLKTLDHCGQNRTRAAGLLGISVRTLRNKINEYRDAGIDIA